MQTDSSKTVQDQDTVIGDAMVEAAQLFYEAANDIARCISENAQCCIDNALLRKAELALAYMQGVAFGLALDDKVQKWYLGEMEKSMATIRDSRDMAFQNQIYVPPRPSEVLEFDEYRVSGRQTFLHCLFGGQPSPSYLKGLQKDIVKDKNLKYLFEKGILDPTKFEGVFEKYPDLAEVPIVEAPLPAEDKSPNATSTNVIPPSGILQMREEKENVAEDDSASATKLRNLLRQGRIDASQYLGALATLVATGLISKGEFSRLKASL